MTNTTEGAISHRFADISALEEAVGTSLGHSEWFLIDQERINVFADATLDDQWIHVDPKRAADGPYGQTIAHGFLTLALVPHLLGELVSVGGLSMEINYGLNRVRFPAALPAGSRVRAHAHLLSVDHGASGAQAVIRADVEAENSERPVVVAEWILLLVP